MNEADNRVLAVFDAYRTAVWDKDVDALLALYDTEVCVFDLWANWRYDGHAAWRTNLDAWLGSLGAQRVTVELHAPVVHVNGELALLHALVRYASVDAGGAEAHSMFNRLSWTLHRDRSGWKILHEHTSAPVDPTTAKVMLQH